jgi:hypothetical protein
LRRNHSFDTTSRRWFNPAHPALDTPPGPLQNAGMDGPRQELLRRVAAAAATAALLARATPAAGFCPREDEGRAWRLAGRFRALRPRKRPPRRG